MSWQNYYQPPDQLEWEGRPDTPENSCFFQVIQFLDLTKPKIKDKQTHRFALLGFKCDEGVRRNLGREGAIEGPTHIRHMLGKLPFHRADFSIYDAGDIVCDNQDLEAAQDALAVAVDAILKNNLTPILMGGGHEIAWGHYQGLASHLAKDNLGILNFDAHFDIRPLLENNLGSSGTPFLQIAKARKSQKTNFDYNCIGIQETGNTKQLFDSANKLSVNFVSADDVYTVDKNELSTFVDRIITDNKHIYLTICLDVFSAAYAPGVSAPQANGLTPWQIIPLLRQAASSAKVLSYDIAELSPKYDYDERTAKLAAKFIYEIIHHHKMN